ncbi:hypothetical protein [Salipiger bermudensis]|uniref:hypothetical protein n=1 Tax=Salipiger bermudensis TaxID=344736 RepID=UPI00300B3A4C
MPKKPRHTDTEIDDMLGRLLQETGGLPTYAALRDALPHGASNDRLAAAMQRLKAGSCAQEHPENCSGQVGSLASSVTGSAEGSDHGALYSVVADARARAVARHAEELEALDAFLASMVAICTEAESRAAATAARTVQMVREQVEADTVARIHEKETRRIRREIYAELADEFGREAEAPRLS